MRRAAAGPLQPGARAGVRSSGDSRSRNKVSVVAWRAAKRIRKFIAMAHWSSYSAHVTPQHQLIGGLARLEPEQNDARVTLVHGRGPLQQPGDVVGFGRRQSFQRRDVEDMAKQVGGGRFGEVGLAAGFQDAVEINPERLAGVLRGRRVARPVLAEGRRNEREQEQERSEKGHPCCYSAATVKPRKRAQSIDQFGIDAAFS